MQNTKPISQFLSRYAFGIGYCYLCMVSLGDKSLELHCIYQLVTYVSCWAFITSWARPTTHWFSNTVWAIQTGCRIWPKRKTTGKLLIKVTDTFVWWGIFFCRLHERWGRYLQYFEFRVACSLALQTMIFTKLFLSCFEFNPRWYILGS